jgi:hypothetical protein
MQLGLYARGAAHEQQTLVLQRDAMTAYAQQRQGTIVLMVEDVGSGVSSRRQRKTLLQAARRRVTVFFAVTTSVPRSPPTGQGEGRVEKND